jgi:hypothetical protein
MNILALKSENSKTFGGAALKINTLVMISGQVIVKSSVLKEERELKGKSILPSVPTIKIDFPYTFKLNVWKSFFYSFLTNTPGEKLSSSSFYLINYCNE